MPVEAQTIVIVVAVAAAAAYVIRSWWPRKEQPGCGSCPANQNRRDDYA